MVSLYACCNAGLDCSGAENPEPGRRRRPRWPAHARCFANLLELDRGRHPHRNVIFFVARSGDRIHRRRMRQHLVLADQRRSRDLRHHESGIQSCARRQKRRQAFVQRRIHQSLDAPLRDPRQRAQSDRQEIESERHRLAVKISARETSANSLHAFREPSRLVDETPADYRPPNSSRSQKSVGRTPAYRAPPHVPAACSAANKRPAPGRNRDATRGSGCPPACCRKFAAAFDLSCMRPRLMNALIECHIGPLAARRASGAKHVGGIRQCLRRKQGQLPTANIACVPLISEIASFASSTSGLISACSTPLPLAMRSPLHISIRLRRSAPEPDAPAAPDRRLRQRCLATGRTGCTPRFSISQSVSITVARTPV